MSFESEWPPKGSLLKKGLSAGLNPPPRVSLCALGGAEFPSGRTP